MAKPIIPPADAIISLQHVSPGIYDRAKKMRQEMTHAELTLWQHLRRNQIAGLHFRRQQVVGNYIVDFYCHAARLVIEVDGGSHSGQQQYDLDRQQKLESAGLKVIRFYNSDIEHNLQVVLSEIFRVCRERTSEVYEEK